MCVCARARRVHGEDPRQIKPIRCNLNVKRGVVNSDFNSDPVMKDFHHESITVKGDGLIYAFINK